MNIGATIKAKRLALGMTQKQLAEKVFVDQSMICQIERGTKTPSLPLGKEIADAIEWTGTRVLCIAGDFTKFDEHAVAQIGRNIELIRYKYFGDDLLMLEWINPVQTAPSSGASGQSLQPAFPTELVAADLPPSPKTRSSVADQLAGMSEEQRVLYDELCGFILSLGDDINVKELQLYVAFTRLKNFVCLRPMHGWFKLWLHLDPDSMTLEKNFSRDVRNKGHWGTGELELSLHSMDDLTKAKPLIERAYQES